MFAAIGYGGISVNQVLGKLIEQYRAANAQDDDEPEFRIVKRSAPPQDKDAVTVQGNRGMAVRLAKCCNPVPGDEIVGYVTRGRGVCVHAKDCRTLRGLELEPERLIDVEWTNDEQASYGVEIQIVAEDRKGLMAEVAQTLADAGRDITSLNANAVRNGIANIMLRATISNVSDLENMMRRLKNLKGVREVFRVNT